MICIQFWVGLERIVLLILQNHRTHQSRGGVCQQLSSSSQKLKIFISFMYLLQKVTLINIPSEFVWRTNDRLWVSKVVAGVRGQMSDLILTGGVTGCLVPQSATRGFTGLLCIITSHHGIQPSALCHSLSLSKRNAGDTELPMYSPSSHDWRLVLLLGDIVSKFNVVSRFLIEIGNGVHVLTCWWF